MAKYRCTRCGKYCYPQRHHHPEPRRYGGQTTVIVCFPCHKRIHSLNGDWATFGRKGGLTTQRLHPHVRQNLIQYRAEKSQ